MQPIQTGAATSFEDDPHISFDRETGKWRYESDDGKEFEYDVVAHAWVPIVRERQTTCRRRFYNQLLPLLLILA